MEVESCWNSLYKFKKGKKIFSQFVKEKNVSMQIKGIFYIQQQQQCQPNGQKSHC